MPEEASPGEVRVGIKGWSSGTLKEPSGIHDFSQGQCHPVPSRGISLLNEGQQVSQAGEPSWSFTTKYSPLLGDGHPLSHLIIVTTQKGKDYCSFVTSEEMEAQRGEVICPRSHSREAPSRPGLPDSRPPSLPENRSLTPHSLPLPYTQQGLNKWLLN